MGEQPKISVILITIRPDYPYLNSPKEYIFNPLLCSLEEQTFTDFELIIIDHIIKSRRTLINPHEWSYPISQIPPKYSIWNEMRYPALSNAWNTGIIHAKGELICTVGDCSKLSPNYLEETYKQFKNGFFISSLMNFVDYKRYEPRRPGICKNANGAWGYCSYSLDALLKSNGFDEQFDGSKFHEETELSLRLSRAGYKFIIPDNIRAFEYHHVPIYNPNKLPCEPDKPYVSQEYNYLQKKFAKSNDVYLQWCHRTNRIRANEQPMPIELYRKLSMSVPTNDLEIYLKNPPIFNLAGMRKIV